MHRHGERGAEGQRHQDAAEADADDRVSGVAEGAEIEFDADQEQEREQGEVAEGRDDREGGGRQEVVRDAGGEPAQQGGAEQDADEDLADDGRLAESADGPAARCLISERGGS